jgi:Kef-type K+ transport system membrane component KefB
LFAELSLIIAIATFIGLIMHLLKQPLIIGHIITGIIVGPALFDIAHSGDGIIEVFAEFGIALLLFIIGLGLNPQVIKEVGKAASLTGAGQVLFTTLFGIGFATLLGFNASEALYIAIALTFSSTIIVLKLLSDKKEQTRLYGKISIGFLLVQDVIATIALVVASTASSTGFTPSTIVELLIKGTLMLLALWLVSTKVLPHMNKIIAGSSEFLFLFAIGWGFGVATLFAEAGFSLEVGALAAGVALTPMVYSQEVGSRLRPLRDFFIVLFFISLGAGLNLSALGDVLPQALVLSSFVLIGNPLIVITIMGLLGYTKKTSFKAGLTVAQISEFSLVFILLARENNAISEEIVSLITVVALITIAASTYMIINADRLYKVVEKSLTMFEKRKTKRESGSSNRYEIMMFGYRKGGAEFIRVFKSMDKKFAVVDYDPEVVDHLEHDRVDYIYGDAMDLELLEEAGADYSKLFIINIADFSANSFLVQALESINPNSVIVCQAENARDAAELYAMGASYVMMPHYIGSEKISAFIKKNGFRKAEFKKYAEKHLLYLQTHRV